MTMCYIAAALQISSLYLMLATSFSNKDDDFEKSLTDDLKKEYKKVVRERSNIFMIASLTGLLICLVIHLLLLKNIIDDVDIKYKVCLYVFVYFMVQYFVYTLYPKKHWMLTKLAGEDNDIALTQKWLTKYKFMKKHWHLGLVIGIISFAMFAYFFSDKKN